MKISDQLDVSKQLSNQQWPQYIAVLSASLISFSMGLHFAWPSPSLPVLLSNESHLNITAEEASYIVIIAPLGNIVGAPLAAILVDVLGRKQGILLTSIPLFTAWMFIGFASSTVIFCIGRFISGIAEGFIFNVYPMYVGEVTEPNIRGVLSCSMSVMNILGMLAINTYASYLSIRHTAFISSIFPLLTVFIFVWMPESPYFLLMKGKTEEAKQALLFLRQCDVSKQLEVLQYDVKRQMSEKGGFRDLLTIKSNRKAMLIIAGVRTVQQMSGVSALGLFTQTIFLETCGNISPVLSTIIYLITQLIMTTYGSILVDKYGRKPLLIFSCIGSGVILNIGGIYFVCKETINYHISWLPMFIMVCFIIMYSLGLGTVPSLMLGELFSTSVKAKALCLMCIYYSIIISIISKLFSLLNTSFGMSAPFFMFGTASLLSVCFCYCVVPETKGKSLEDIQQYLKGNENNDNSRIKI